MSFWGRIGFGKKESVLTLPAEELGIALFDSACKLLSKDLKNPDDLRFLWSIRDRINQDIFDAEFLIMKMYAAMDVITATVNSEEEIYGILDSMNNAFINSMNTADRNTDKQTVHHRLTARYKEYTDARKEKRGPNELWPLSHHMLKNLLGKETLDDDTQDAYIISALSVQYSRDLLIFKDILKGIQIKSK